jgi:hypothetical protein
MDEQGKLRLNNIIRHHPDGACGFASVVNECFLLSAYLESQRHLAGAEAQYQEQVAEVNRVMNEKAELEESIKELHKPSSVPVVWQGGNDGELVPACMNGCIDSHGNLEAWPCATVRLLPKEKDPEIDTKNIFEPWPTITAGGNIERKIDD